jgi:hypothetical protein
VGAFTFILHAAAQDVWRERVEYLRDQYQKWGLELNVYFLTMDFDVISSDRAKSWVTDAGLAEGGGLLVRPDQHILMPLRETTGAAAILSAMKGHLGR